MPAIDSIRPLTQEQIGFYEENGFIQLPEFLAPEEVREIKDALVRACENGDQPAPKAAPQNYFYGRVFDQRVNLWRQDEAMRAIVFSRRFSQAARQLAGGRAVRLFHDHALFKPGYDSRPTNWHQDTVYWPMNEDDAFSIWIALDDVDERNGCLQFIPRSRNFGRQGAVDLTGNDTRAIFKQLKAGQQPAEVFVARMKAGGVTFHHGLTFHYAGANRSGRPRHALAIIYMPDGVTYNGKAHLVTDGLGLVPGQPFAGDCFPLLTEAGLRDDD
jgi:ectoine hydroxylase-related dioxygenase (phytanoyl-CoA dioxygenase family)